MRGMELLEELSKATGLPDELIGEELSRLISGAGKTTDAITLDELRELLASYLQDILVDAKQSFDCGAKQGFDFGAKQGFDEADELPAPTTPLPDFIEEQK